MWRVKVTSFGNEFIIRTLVMWYAWFNFNIKCYIFSNFLVTLLVFAWENISSYGSWLTFTLAGDHSHPQTSTFFFFKESSRVALVTEKIEIFDWPFKNEGATRYPSTHNVFLPFFLRLNLKCRPVFFNLTTPTISTQSVYGLKQNY